MVTHELVVSTLIHCGLLGGNYLQDDETPVRYLDPGNGCNQCSTG